jgi:hypothetical protein
MSSGTASAWSQAENVNAGTSSTGSAQWQPQQDGLQPRSVTTTIFSGLCVVTDSILLSRGKSGQGRIERVDGWKV